MSLTRDLQNKARDVGFALVGISGSESLKGLPHGMIGNIINLRSVVEEFPFAKSVILLGFHAWDKAFNLAVSAPGWLGYGMHDPSEQFEWYQLYYEIVKNMAWEIINFLGKRGFESILSVRIPPQASSRNSGFGLSREKYSISDA